MSPPRIAPLALSLPLFLLAAGLVPAAAQSPLPIHVYPLSSAPALTAAGEPPTPVDPRAAEIAAKVPAVFARARKRPQIETLRRSRQARALAALQAQGSSGVEMRLRPGAGTPMLLRPAVTRVAGASAWKQDDEAVARGFLRSHRDALALDDPDSELTLERADADELGQRHLRFAQMRGGVPVWPGEILVHLDAGGNVTALNGAYVRSPRRVALQPKLDAAAAVEAARGHVREGATAIAGPAELIVYAPLRKRPRLAWKVELEVTLSRRWLVIVDAGDGHKLNAFDAVAKAAQQGTGVDVFGENQPLQLWEEGGTYFLADSSKPMFDPTSDPPNPSTARGEIAILDARNQPPTDDPQTLPDLFQVSAAAADGPWLRDGVSAAKTLAETYDYYLERHGRNSIDGQGGNLVAVVRLGQNLANAFWTNGLMLFGDAAPYPGGLDVAAHELTHGITERTAGLVYQNQPGAANEAFSDIFGENVEARSLGEADWLKGARITDPIQNYANCSALHYLGRRYPSRMSEYINTAEDNGGVHGNSCIINHAYYLLAEGLPNAIGLRDAERIFYRALTTHLLRNSQFVDVRLACVLSAEEIYGNGSAQALRTAEAFDAVEIFDGPGTPPPPEFPGVDGPDASVVVYYDSELDDFFLGRRESALGDPEEGISLSGSAVQAQRPSVTGDGALAVFVSGDNDACTIPTDAGPDVFEECLGSPETTYSASISPDGRLLALVLLADSGQPGNTISVVDTESGDVRTFPLRAPLVDGKAIGTVLFAEVMDFTADGHFLLYDAFDQIELGNGATAGVYSVYALDLVNDRTLLVVAPDPGVNVGNPSLSQTSDNFLALDVIEGDVGQSITVNLTTGEAVDLASIQGTSFPVGVPGYTGDDSALIYTQADADTILGLSLLRQEVTDRQTPKGAPTLWLSDAAYGVIYRRGDFTGPQPTATPTRINTAPPTPTPTPAACVGDCDGGGQVDVSEVVSGVQAALTGSLTGDACLDLDRDQDGVVSVDEVVGAVVGKVYGCLAIR